MSFIRELQQRQVIRVTLLYLGIPDWTIRFILLLLGLGLLAWLWWPLSRPSINRPEIQRFFHAIGIADYWSRHGWPEQCEPVSDQRFECR